MARTAILSNGSLAVGLDENGLVHDFYFPYVGLDNLTTSRDVHHKIGVWVDGAFSWVDDDSWTKQVDLDENSLTALTKLRNDNLNIEINSKDFVDFEENVFCRKVEVTNLSDNSRDIKIFFHQVFQISRGGRADTALYVPEENYILDYKGRVCLLASGKDQDNNSFDQFAVGNYGIEGKEGTFRDAEDGVLSGSNVEHGGVDSVIRFSLYIGSGSTKSVDYWVAAADTQQNLEKINTQLKFSGLNNRFLENQSHWNKWISISADKISKLDPAHISEVKKSLLFIKAHMDKNGGIIASCDSSIYNYGRDYYSYVWPRDGAFAIWPLIKFGYFEEAKSFFKFCESTINPAGYMMHKYQPDKSIGSTWHPLLHKNQKELAIQEDETSIVIFMLGEYDKYSGDTAFIQEMYKSLVKPAADFMTEFIDAQTGLPHASYDLWEMKFYTTTYTTASVYKGLKVASEFAKVFDQNKDALAWSETANTIKRNSDKLFLQDKNYYAKGLILNEQGDLDYDKCVDASSLYGIMMFDLCNNPEQLESMFLSVKEKLFNQTPSGGVARFEQDGYFLADSSLVGNPWLVTTLWLAQYYSHKGMYTESYELIDWIKSKSLNSFSLPEQVDANTGAILSVTPLVWSHAEYINTIIEVSKSRV